MNIIGCDLHTRYQVVAWIDEATGEIRTRRLEHENGEARAFYASWPRGARIGIEATFPVLWFERLASECGHELWVGDAARIRASEVRQQKTDTRDAESVSRRSGPAARESFSAHLGAVAGGARSAPVAGAWHEAGADAHHDEESVSRRTRSGDEPGRVSKKQAVERERESGAEKPGAVALGEPAPEGTAGRARSTGGGHRTAGPGGEARSTRSGGGGASDDAPRSRSGGEFGLRADAGIGGALRQSVSGRTSW
jgi:hypothetical protein